MKINTKNSIDSTVTFPGGVTYQVIGSNTGVVYVQRPDHAYLGAVRFTVDEARFFADLIREASDVAQTNLPVDNPKKWSDVA